MRRNGLITRQELIDTALKILYKEGYDKTSVQKIIDQVGISKGGFYHHFKSKDDLFESLIFPYMNLIKRMLQLIVEDDKLNALEKFNKMTERTRQIKASHKDLSSELAQMWLKGRISFLVPSIITKYKETIKPLWYQVIKQGHDEGLFDNPNVEDVTDLIILLGTELNKKMGEYFMNIVKNREKKQELLKIMEEKALFMEDTLERLLGVPDKIRFAEPYMKNIYFFVEVIVEPLGDFLKES